MVIIQIFLGNLSRKFELNQFPITWHLRRVNVALNASCDFLSLIGT
jgi:hypothetical protein